MIQLKTFFMFLMSHFYAERFLPPVSCLNTYFLVGWWFGFYQLLTVAFLHGLQPVFSIIHENHFPVYSSTEPGNKYLAGFSVFQIYSLQFDDIDWDINLSGTPVQYSHKSNPVGGESNLESIIPLFPVVYRRSGLSSIISNLNISVNYPLSPERLFMSDLFIRSTSSVGSDSVLKFCTTLLSSFAGDPQRMAIISLQMSTTFDFLLISPGGTCTGGEGGYCCMR